MRRGQDIAVQLPGLFLVHHNLPGVELGRHSHPQHLIFIPLQGEIHLQLDERLLIAGPTRLIYLPPATLHSFQSSETQGERLIALVEPKAWSTAEAGVFEPSVIAAHQLAKEMMFYLLLNPKTRHAASLVDTLVRILEESLGASCHLLEIEHLDGKIKDPRLKRALSYLAENLAEPISPTDAAKAAGLSPRSFTRLCAGELGLTPKQCLSQFRVARARELLQTGRRSVTEVAFEVGYQSMASFIATFRLLTGQLPSEVARLGARA